MEELRLKDTECARVREEEHSPWMYVRVGFGQRPGITLGRTSDDSRGRSTFVQYNTVLRFGKSQLFCLGTSYQYQCISECSHQFEWYSFAYLSLWPSVYTSMSKVCLPQQIQLVVPRRQEKGSTSIISDLRQQSRTALLCKQTKSEKFYINTTNTETI